jgi:hypothetical protein
MFLTSLQARRTVVAGVACALLACSPAAAGTTDLRPPDVRYPAPAVLTAPQDLRSPDARDAATGSPAPVTVVPVRVSDPAPATAESGTDWTLIVLAVVGYLLAVGVVALATVRRRHRVAV